MENEVSYRQVGREKGYVPPPRLKDEGVQRKGGGKRDAFGIRTERFSKPTNDVPPPGAYYRPSTMERDGRVCGSVSAKGFGSGFVSATPRFRDVKMLQEACLPGPGSYNAQPESGQEGGKLTSFSSLKRDCRLAPDQLTAAPGPGEYNIDRRDNPRIATGPTSSFRCTRTPLAVGTHLQTPAPGAYEILQGQHVQADKNGLILKDPFFRSQTKRSASFIASSDVPGPGEYDVDRGVATVKEACGTGAGGGGGGKGQGGVSAGRPGHQRCGHAREDEESSPGPGWYTPHQTKPQMRSSSSSSMFRSGTKRFSRSTVAGAPGPAFYQPEPLGKKSFRWNATKQWM